MSLQSRLDIMCEESDGESVLTVGAGEEGNDELSTGESFLLLNLQSLRSDMCNVLIIVPEKETSRNKEITIVVEYNLLS